MQRYFWCRRSSDDNTGSFGPLFWTSLDYGDDPDAPRWESVWTNEIERRYADPEEVPNLRRGHGFAFRYWGGRGVAVGLWRRSISHGLLSALDGHPVVASPSDIRQWDDDRSDG